MTLINSVQPDKSTYKPGESANIFVNISNNDAQSFQGRVTLELNNIDGAIDTQEQTVEIAANGAITVQFSVTPPAQTLRGYGLEATLYGTDGATVSAKSGALDVLERWSQAPRYGFLSQFAPGDGDKTDRFDSLRGYHLNVVQFYDWMWRHYRLLPPTDVYTDALDRTMSLDSVNKAIRAVQGDGAAALAYGAVYGAEPEYSLAHRDQMLFDADKKPVSLAELFYIMDISPESAWTPMIVAEFGETVQTLDFDGIHLDQYGFPKETVFTEAGQARRLAEDFPPLIDAAREAVVAAKPSAGVIFNAVENWPIETVAPTTQDVVYIEVWPPYVSYNDLRQLINNAKTLGNNKQVILAAYLTPFGEATDETVAGAEVAALLSTAVITSSGGFHLLLGEREGVLCDPYYPKYATFRPDFAAKMREYYDFLVRYEEFFVSPDFTDWEVSGATLNGAKLSAQAETGAVWAIGRQKPGAFVLNLVNMSDQQKTEWNALREQPSMLENLELSVTGLPELARVVLLSPDSDLGKAQDAVWQQENGVTTVAIPSLTVWTSVVFLPA